jgi:2-polyprenyl-6-methoxyphenol hydroxylase-like FAD-dependent oxidoreductase
VDADREDLDMTTRSDTHAIVLGRGMAGLLAARALSERFGKVTVIDRDRAPSDDADRPGVPQGRHAHALLASGQQILEELFPGLTSELAAAGAPTGDVLGDTAMHLNGHRLASTHTGMVAVSASRPMLEHHVHRRVASIENVIFAPPADVVGLTAEGNQGRVTGVRLLRHADDSPGETLGADLVVDALGRTSRAPRWFEAIGHDPPDEDRIAVDLRYATCCFRAHPDDLEGLIASIHGPTPARPRGCALARIEGDRWMLTLAGMSGECPPRSHDGFAAFARSLGAPEIDKVLDGAEPLDDAVIFRFPASTRRRYERLGSRPPGFLAVGDSLCSLNPVYGQGMSVAAQQARAMLTSVHVTSDALWPTVAQLAEDAWNIVRATDLAFPGVDGHRRIPDRIVGRYVQELHAAAATDPVLSEAFVRVAGLVDPPTRLLAPRVASRTLVNRAHERRRSMGSLRIRGGLSPARMCAAALMTPTMAIAGTVAATAIIRTALRRARRAQC